jgi:PhoPQ-activated pathogenicity-related protein
MNHTNTACILDSTPVLLRYLQRIDGAYKLTEQTSDYDNRTNITTLTYHLISQSWPIGEQELFGQNLWQHELILYKPDVLLHHTALLYVNGGDNHDIAGNAIFTAPKYEKINFAEIALKSHALVAEVRDVPNQFLRFASDNKVRKEDEILAYSYKKFLENPLENAYWAGHLPMAKAITMTMNALVEIMPETQDFIVAGASKRGWATWLAAIGDDRISSIITIAMDALNTQENIKHICKSYGGTCPFALKDYVQTGIISQIDTEGMHALMEIEDPFSYINSARMTIPKYIISNSGDDFFVPDSTKFYFKALTGNNNYLRVLPNSSHYVNNNITNDILNQYLTMFLDCKVFPKLDWQHSDQGFNLTLLEQPQEITLWLAVNEENRDFRYNKYPLDQGNIRYSPLSIDYDCQIYPCNVIVATPQHPKGWQAAFIEVGYKYEDSTFETKITPDTYL